MEDHAGTRSIYLAERGERVTARFVLDGAPVECEVSPRELLSDVLRHRLGVTGVHVGCEQGVCGACTVTLDGAPARSCLLLGVQADGCEVTTVRSLHASGSLHPLQSAFRDEHGLQCGFCTPGVLVSLAAAASDGLSATEALDEVLPGHLCRCTGYGGIRAAVRSAWQDLVGSPDAEGSLPAPSQGATA